MKLKLLLSTVFLFILLVGINGCDKETKYDIYENHNVSVCNIEDPLTNIVWLKDYCKANSKKRNTVIYVLEDKITKENYLGIYTNSEIKGFMNINVFNCSGELLFKWYTGTPPSPEYNAFFSNKEVVNKIWEVK